jgi:hypothetical protein
MFTVEAYPADEAGRVLAVRKKVYLFRDGKRNDAKPRMGLFMKDAVETDVRSRTKLYFTDDSILNLGEVSRVVVEEYLYSSEKERSKSVYRLVDGALKVVVGRSDLEVHTPTAVAAARGTIFIIWIEGVEGAKKTCAMVIEGGISLQSIIKDIKKTVIVEKGNMSCVSMGKAPEDQYAASGSLRDQFMSKTAVVGGVVDYIGEGVPDRPPDVTGTRRGEAPGVPGVAPGEGPPGEVLPGEGPPGGVWPGEDVDGGWVDGGSDGDPGDDFPGESPPDVLDVVDDPCPGCGDGDPPIIIPPGGGGLPDRNIIIIFP